MGLRTSAAPLVSSSPTPVANPHSMVFRPYMLEIRYQLGMSSPLQITVLSGQSMSMCLFHSGASPDAHTSTDLKSHAKLEEHNEILGMLLMIRSHSGLMESMLFPSTYQPLTRSPYISHNRLYV